jgi:hypothetical protein
MTSTTRDLIILFNETVFVEGTILGSKTLRNHNSFRNVSLSKKESISNVEFAVSNI